MLLLTINRCTLCAVTTAEAVCWLETNGRCLGKQSRNSSHVWKLQRRNGNPELCKTESRSAANWDKLEAFQWAACVSESSFGFLRSVTPSELCSCVLTYCWFRFLFLCFFSPWLTTGDGFTSSHLIPRCPQNAHKTKSPRHVAWRVTKEKREVNWRAASWCGLEFCQFESLWRNSGETRRSRCDRRFRRSIKVCRWLSAGHKETSRWDRSPAANVCCSKRTHTEQFTVWFCRTAGTACSSCLPHHFFYFLSIRLHSLLPPQHNWHFA